MTGLSLPPIESSMERRHTFARSLDLVDVRTLPNTIAFFVEHWRWHALVAVVPVVDVLVESKHHRDAPSAVVFLLVRCSELRRLYVWVTSGNSYCTNYLSTSNRYWLDIF
jgi:hypothetical protein